MLVVKNGGRMGHHVLGAKASNFCWMVPTNSLICCGGRAQNTKQCRGSSNPGSILGFSSFWRTGSNIISWKSGASILAFCWAFRVSRWVAYLACISTWGQISPKYEIKYITSIPQTRMKCDPQTTKLQRMTEGCMVRWDNWCKMWKPNTGSSWHASIKASYGLAYFVISIPDKSSNLFFESAEPARVIGAIFDFTKEGKGLLAR